MSQPGLVLIDGATGTELSRAGVDVSLPLWSARALLDAPETLQSIHQAYLHAGAGGVTTATFRTHARSLAKEDIGERAAELTRLAVEIARAARDAVDPQALVLGSVAPLEECYDPSLAPDAASCERLGIRCLVLERRASENYLTDRAVKVVLGEGAEALDHYAVLREADVPWSKSQNWKIAAEV